MTMKKFNLGPNITVHLDTMAVSRLEHLRERAQWRQHRLHDMDCQSLEAQMHIDQLNSMCAEVREIMHVPVDQMSWSGEWCDELIWANQTVEGMLLKIARWH